MIFGVLYFWAYLCCFFLYFLFSFLCIFLLFHFSQLFPFCLSLFRILIWPFFISTSSEFVYILLFNFPATLSWISYWSVLTAGLYWPRLYLQTYDSSEFWWHCYSKKIDMYSKVGVFMIKVTVTTEDITSLDTKLILKDCIFDVSTVGQQRYCYLSRWWKV